MSDEPDLGEQLLDLFVYIPLGIALEAKDLVPKLAERGRGQVALARFAGKVAADRSQGDPRKLIEQVVTTLGTFLAGDEPEAAADVDNVVSLSGDDGDLPIGDYDSLSAPQLLPHLEPLSSEQLTDVLAYEEDHRSRATVINRIKQLQA